MDIVTNPCRLLQVPKSSPGVGPREVVEMERIITDFGL